MLGHGTRLGPYEIAGSLGAGGMGEVFRARCKRNGLCITIKVHALESRGEAPSAATFHLLDSR